MRLSMLVSYPPVKKVSISHELLALFGLLYELLGLGEKFVDSDCIVRAAWLRS